MGLEISSSDGTTASQIPGKRKKPCRRGIGKEYWHLRWPVLHSSQGASPAKQAPSPAEQPAPSPKLPGLCCTRGSCSQRGRALHPNARSRPPSGRSGCAELVCSSAVVGRVLWQLWSHANSRTDNKKTDSEGKIACPPATKDNAGKQQWLDKWAMG